MRIGLHDAEKEYLHHKIFPNYALMKISAYHKAKGDLVDWWNPLTTAAFDAIYSSKVFDFTPDNPYLPSWTIRGGTGYSDIPINQLLSPEIDAMFPDYTIYPECDYAIGYLTRGCPNHCPWCVVPAKEGGIKPYRTWEQVVRQDTNKLVLMDNNILASEHGIAQLESMIGSGYAIDLNQGMDRIEQLGGLEEIGRAVQERPKHGTWYGEGDGYADGKIVYDVWECSQCGHIIDDGTDNQEQLPNYCPNCGAKMKEV